MTEQPKRVADLFRAMTALSKEVDTPERRLVALVGNIALRRCSLTPRSRAAPV